MTDAELKNYHAAINDCWHFFKEFASYTGEKEKEYWFNMIMAADDVKNKYDAIMMVESILDIMVAELQRKWRTERRLPC